MKILILGGMHGNEPLGPSIVNKLTAEPIKGVDGIIANELAYKAHSRFIEQDMNRSFPGIKNSTEYEHQRPIQLMKISKKYDLVIDFHNTHCPQNDCCFIGKLANRELKAVVTNVGLNRVVIADYDCINKYVSNCISIEISLTSPNNNVVYWYDQILKLSKQKINDLQFSKSLEEYQFAYRMTIEDKERLSLDKQRLEAFKPLPETLANALGVRSPAFPIFINDKYTPYNFGGILNKIK